MSSIGNLNSLRHNDSVYDFAIAISHLRDDTEGFVRLPFDEATGRIISENINERTTRPLFFKDIIELRIIHNVTSPIITAEITYRDEQSLLVNHVNTNRSVLRMSITRNANPAYAGQTASDSVVDGTEFTYEVSFLVDKSEIIDYTDGTATYKLSLVSLNWFNFNNNWVGGTRFSSTWETLMASWFNQNFVARGNLPVLDTRNYTFNSTPDSYITPANSTLMDNIEYVFNRIINANNGLFFVTLNPVLGNYYLWKYNDDERNRTLNPVKTANVIVLKDKSADNLFMQQNSAFKLRNNSWSGATEVFKSIRGFSSYNFDYSKGIWDSTMNVGTTTDNALRVSAASLIQTLGGGVSTPVGYSAKYMNSPKDPSFIPNENNRFWYEWSSSNRQENLWSKFRKIILENGITAITVGGDLRRLPGSLINLYSNPDSVSYNTSNAFIGTRSLLQIEHNFTKAGYNNVLYFGTIYALTDVEIAT